MYAGTLLAGIYLVARYMLLLLHISFTNDVLIYNVLAIAAGVFLIANHSSTRNRHLGLTVTGVWFVLAGLLALLNLHFAQQGIVMDVLAVAAGALLLIAGPRAMRWRLGLVLLAIWLLLVGLLPLLGKQFAQQELVLAVLAIAAGVLLLLRR